MSHPLPAAPFWLVVAFYVVALSALVLVIPRCWLQASEADRKQHALDAANAIHPSRTWIR